MNKYIDAEKLIAEIHKHIGKYDSMLHEWSIPVVKGKREEAFSILTIVESLQQENTLSKEEIADRIADWISRNPDFFFNGDTKEVMNEIRKLV